MTKNVTSDYLYDLKKLKFNKPYRVKYKTKANDHSSWSFTIKAIWRPFDLAITKNVTSDDLHDLKN